MSDLKTRIEEANQKALDTILAGRPVWVDVRPALEVVPGMVPNLILHAGPPIAWRGMGGPQRNGIVGAVLYEGLAATREEAVHLLESGRVAVEPCHHHSTVGAGTGITTASMPMVVIRNETHSNFAYSNLFESGSLQGLKWGCYDETIAAHLRWETAVLAPALGAALRASGGLDVKSLIAKAVQMGDECHNRSIAASSLFFREIAPHLLRTASDEKALRESMEFLAKADHFFLHVTMAAAKAMLEAAREVPYSTLVTTMCRNGVEFGLRVAGLGDQWFTAPANLVEGLYFRTTWGPQDAGPDLGDSCITETVGLGGFIQAAAPSVQQYVGGNLQRALRTTAEMREICAGSNLDFRIPNLDFDGAPLGIDVRKVVQTGIAPLIETAITHREAGLIGAGEVRAPMGCFEKALRAFVARYAAQP